MTTRRMTLNSVRSATSWLFAAVVLTSGPAHAFTVGDTCTLKAELPITLTTPQGSLQATWDARTPIEVLALTEEGVARISNGDVNALVRVVELESACEGTLRTCTLVTSVTMYQHNRSDSQAWEIKIGAPVSILKAGKAWAYVHIADLDGYVPSASIAAACPRAQNPTVVIDTTQEPDAADVVERGDGPGVALVPLSLQADAPAGVADAYAQLLWASLLHHRPDAARLDGAGARDAPWKSYVGASVDSAKSAGLRYVIVGRLVRATTASDVVDTVQVAVIDTRSRATLKAIQLPASLQPSDPWVRTALAHMLPLVDAAPGSSIPELLQTDRITSAAAEGGDVESVDAPAQTTSWLFNPLALSTVAASALCGLAAGATGAFALSTNATANSKAVTDPTRTQLRSQALVAAIIADSVAGAAVVLGLTSVALFVGGVE